MLKVTVVRTGKRHKWPQPMIIKPTKFPYLNCFSCQQRTKNLSLSIPPPKTNSGQRCSKKPMPNYTAVMNTSKVDFSAKPLSTSLAESRNSLTCGCQAPSPKQCFLKFLKLNSVVLTSERQY